MGHSPSHRSSRLLRRTCCTLLLVGLLCCGPACDRALAQAPTYDVHPDYLVKHFTVEEGLPLNTITGLVQGRDEYLWMATFDGFVRFDGERFTVFNTDNSPGLPSNRLHRLVEDGEGALWTITEAGDLVRYHDGLFTVFGQDRGVPGRVNELQVEGDTLWLLTQGGLALMTGGRVRRLYPEAIQGDVRAALWSTRSGDLWVGTRKDGLYRVRAGGDVQHFTFASRREEPEFEVEVLHEDHKGVLWVGLARQGGVYRIQGDRLEPLSRAGQPWAAHVALIDPDLDDPETLWFGSRGGPLSGWWSYRDGALQPFPAVESGEAHHLLPGPDGALWRLQGRWLYRDDTPILRTQAIPRFLRFDREGNLWVAGGLGLYRLRRRTLRTLSEAEGLPGRNLYPILEDRQGRIWLGLWSAPGLARLDGATVTTYDVRSCCVASFYEDRAGTLWVGTQGWPCSMQGERCVSFDLAPVSIQGTGVRAMHEDRQGRFWFGTEHGLFLGRPAGAGRSWTHFTTETGLTNNWVRAIVEARNGDVLFGTNGGGLLRYRDDDTFEAFTSADGLASDHVRDIYEDRDGLLWIATEDRGLCRLDRRGSPAMQGAGLACLDADDGLFDNSLHRILEDDYGRFWFNTNRGIFWVERAELNAFAQGEVTSVTSVSYTERDGMRNREGNGGVQPAGIKASDGRLWFPTQDGAVVIDPAQVQRPAAPSAVIETVTVGGQTRQAGGTLVLAADERDLDIGYTALAFSQPEDVRFRYMLEGYDDVWNDVGDRRTATYTNLPPGRYVFRVKAGLGGAWSEDGASLALERRPFFWETTWFYGLVALFFAFVGPSIYVYRVRRLKARQEALEQTVAERTAQIRAHETQLEEQNEQLQAHQARLEQQADELRRANALKSRFLANISHEFRTPLTLTFGPLDDLLSGQFSGIDQARSHLERARRNGHRLLRLINQLLDLSRLDAGALRLHARRYDLVPFLQQRLAVFESLAASRRLRLRFTAEAERLPHVFDAERLETVVLNLISNAFKFTPEGGTITVAVRKDDAGQAVLSVHDTGVGIPPEHLPYLFDRFYQVDGSTTRAREGTGIGLALVKQLVDLHGGHIAVESTVGQGTTFTVTLPEREAGAAWGDDGGPAGSRTAEVVLADLARSRPGGDGAPAEEVGEEATVVLVVEDNADMRAYIRAHLEAAYHVVEAANGVEGLEQARALVPDLVLSDVMMPQMDGFDLLAALKADERTSHVPVVLLTARADVESKLHGLDTGADDYLAKPFNADELNTRVRNLIEQRRLLREKYSREVLVLGAREVTLPSMEAAFLARVHQAIEDNLSDAHFGVDALAEAVGMSPRQLLRKLKALTDESPNALLRRVRLERAAALLGRKAMTVKEVAHAVGFRSLPYFAKTFCEVYGVAPSAYTDDA